MKVYKDLEGKTFGRLAVLWRHLDIIREDGHKVWRWLAQCTCGKLCLVKGCELIAGRVSSCGCARREATILCNKRRSIHGEARSRLYTIWHCMKSRCYYKLDINYKNYGGRGISVCEEWKNSYTNFRAWALSNGYDDTLTIDRIDNDGNYQPNNCKWSTLKEQASNKRYKASKLSLTGECISVLAVKYGIPMRRLYSRLRYGWSLQRALTEPVRANKRWHRKEM